MTQPAHKSVRDEIDDIRRNGDPRFSDKAKAAVAQLVKGNELGDAIDEITKHDFDDVDRPDD